jgi:hypothetical protein
MAITISGSTGIAGVDGSAGTPAIQGTDTNTGIYFPGADRVGITEGGTQVAEFDASGNFKFNSGYGSVETAYGCRAWVNFNGTGTVAIRASGNVTSITDNTTGSYTINFTSAMPNVNYAMTGNAWYYGVTAAIVSIEQPNSSTTSKTIATTNLSGAAVDVDNVQIAVFR